MAEYYNLRQTITNAVKTNGNKEITGSGLQNVLIAMVDALGGHTFKGIATPSTNPGNPDENVFYIATQPGTYTNFYGAVVTNQVAIFKNNIVMSGWDIIFTGIPITDTTYTAGNGLTLTGTVFSLPITISGTGTFVQSVTQTTNGLTVALGTPAGGSSPDTSDLAELITGTSTTGKLQTAKNLKDWLTAFGFITSVDWGDIISIPSWVDSETKPTYGIAEITGLSTALGGLLAKSGGVLEDYVEKLVTTTGTINLNDGNVFFRSANANTTFSISNAKVGAHSFTLIIEMGASVTTLTFPPSVKWDGGAIPDMTTANKTYILTFVTVNQGATWFGMDGGQF